MGDAQGHWCSFCQTHHSSVSCYHPGNPARYVNPETGHGSATGTNEPAVMTAYVEDWKQRAEQAEAEAATLRRMLREAFAPVVHGYDYDGWLADLRERAGEE